jgi:hypothetical protein
MTGEPPMSTNEKRRGEPEIIPPGRYDRESGAGRADMRVFVDGSIMRHVFVARLGPLGALLVALIIAIACAKPVSVRWIGGRGGWLRAGCRPSAAFVRRPQRPPQERKTWHLRSFVSCAWH